MRKEKRQVPHTRFRKIQETQDTRARSIY